MFCSNCGISVLTDAKFCSSCGSKVLAVQKNQDVLENHQVLPTEPDEENITAPRAGENFPELLAVFGAFILAIVLTVITIPNFFSTCQSLIIRSANIWQQEDLLKGRLAGLECYDLPGYFAKGLVEGTGWTYLSVTRASQITGALLVFGLYCFYPLFKKRRR